MSLARLTHQFAFNALCDVVMSLWVALEIPYFNIQPLKSETYKGNRCLACYISKLNKHTGIIAGTIAILKRLFIAFFIANYGVLKKSLTLTPLPFP